MTPVDVIDEGARFIAPDEQPRPGDQRSRAPSLADLVDAEQVRHLTGWKRDKVYRFFKENAAHLISVAGRGGHGGIKRLAPVAILPEDARRRHESRVVPIRPATADAEDDAAWLASLPAFERRRVAERQLVLNRWAEFRAAFGQREITLARQAFVDSGECSDVTTLWRWEKAFRREGIRGLASGYGNRTGVLKVKARTLDDIVNWYCDRSFSGRTKRQAYEHYLAQCRARGEEPVSESSLTRLLSTKHVEMAKRRAQMSPEEFRAVYGLYITRTRAYSYPCECYVGDHKRQNNWCVSADGKRVIRPWLTMWIDYATNRIVGLRICESPNSESILASFVDAVTIAGKPDRIYVDNGKDYRSERFGAVIFYLGIAEHHSQTRNAKAKTIERVNREFAQRFGRAMPGYCGKDPTVRPHDTERLRLVTRAAIADGKPLGLAHRTAPTWEEFALAVDRFVRWHNEEHASTAETLDGRTPMQAWNDAAPTGRTVSEKALAFALMPWDMRSVDRGHVRMHRKKYENFDLLDLWHGHSIRVRYNPDNLSRVFLFNPENDAYLGHADEVRKVRTFNAEQTRSAVERSRRLNRELGKKLDEVAGLKRRLANPTPDDLLGTDPPMTPAPSLDGGVTITEITKLDRPARDMAADAEKAAVNDAKMALQRAVSDSPALADLRKPTLRPVAPVEEALTWADLFHQHEEDER